MARVLQKELDAELRPLDLSVPLYLALEAAHDGAPRTPGVLAQACGVTPAAMHSTLVRLRTRRLVSTTLAVGGRSTIVVLTDLGQVRLTQAHAVVDECETRLFRHLSPEQVEDLWVSLTLLAGTTREEGSPSP